MKKLILLLEHYNNNGCRLSVHTNEIRWRRRSDHTGLLYWDDGLHKENGSLYFWYDTCNKNDYMYQINNSNTLRLRKI
jgi:hypothetical protein